MDKNKKASTRNAFLITTLGDLNLQTSVLKTKKALKVTELKV